MSSSFGTLPVPGATVTATQGDKKVVAVTDATGTFVLKDLGEGKAALKVEMRGFAPTEKEVAVAEAPPISR
ncbi:MAG: carboxypeptidase-like regulatory domain-containing protein [Acidobacteriota bacterium]